MPPPQNWYPKVFPTINCQTMAPYLYNPLPGIPFKNLPGATTIVNNQSQAYDQNYNNANYQGGQGYPNMDPNGYQMNQMN